MRRLVTDLTGRTFTMPPQKHAGHTMTVEREDAVSVDRWVVKCECGETLPKVPGHLIAQLLDEE